MSPCPSSCSAPLIEDGARIHLGRHLEGDAGGDIGLDQAGDHVHRRPLGGQDQVHTGGTGLLGQAGDQLFHLLAHHHHQVGQLVHYDHDIGQRFQGGRRRRGIEGGSGL
jgi:hypothetical protein